MHIQSKKILRDIACRFLEEREDVEEAWQLYRDEALARYSADDDGPSNQYHADAFEIFKAEKRAAYDQAIGMTEDEG